MSDERDRMLQIAVELLAEMVSDHGPRDVTEDEVLADLRSRAETTQEYRRSSARCRNPDGTWRE